MPDNEHLSLRQSARLESIIWPCVRDNHLGQVFFGPFDVMLSYEDMVQPDLIFVSGDVGASPIAGRS